MAGAPSFICAALYVRESCHNLNLILLFRLLMYTKEPFVWLCWLCLLFFFSSIGLCVQCAQTRRNASLHRDAAQTYCTCSLAKRNSVHQAFQYCQALLAGLLSEKKKAHIYFNRRSRNVTSLCKYDASCVVVELVVPVVSLPLLGCGPLYDFMFFFFFILTPRTVSLFPFLFSLSFCLCPDANDELHLHQSKANKKGHLVLLHYFNYYCFYCCCFFFHAFLFTLILSSAFHSCLATSQTILPADSLSCLLPQDP